ncbi:MAG: thioredoxin [candidate division WWE3 bacterium]|nr:thioredoxin [candidate division WWE3 bacterium]
MTELNDQLFASEVTQSKGITLVDFWAPWCGPCKRLGPLLEEIAKEYEPTVKFTKFNVDDGRNTSDSFEILSIPTVIIFKDGVPGMRIEGAMTKKDYTDALDQALGSSATKASDNLDVNTTIPIIFTTSTCSWCAKLKDYLKSRNVEYKEINVGENEAAATQMTDKSNHMGVPQMWYKGEVIVGYDEAQLQELFGK